MSKFINKIKIFKKQILMEINVIKNAHSFELSEISDALDTTVYGLYDQEAISRLEKYGPNELVQKKKNSPFLLFIGQFLTPLNGILILAALISLLANHAIDAYVIFCVILINSIIGFIQEYKAELAIESLKKMGAPEAEVLRKTQDGKSVEFEIPAREIVPGDVIILGTGDRVPADARLITCMNLHADESMLTGESIPSSKNLKIYDLHTPLGDRKNMVFGGTLIVQGRAKAMVIGTGMKSEMGKIADIIQNTEDVEIPMKKNIHALTKMLGYLALLCSGTVFSVALIRGVEISEAFLFGVASAVSSIPEGLPIVVTITLAIAVKKMADNNAIVRKINAVDTLGTISAIVSDKTGTLTTNQITVRSIWTNSHDLSVTGSGFEPKGEFLLNGAVTDPLGHPEVERLLDIMILCNDAHLRDHRDEYEEKWIVNGDPTEGALIALGMKANIEKDSYEISHPRVDEIGFDSAHKYMATFHNIKDESSVLTCVKGAPEVILGMCSSIQKGEKGTEPLNKERHNEIMSVATDYAKKAYRVLGFAYIEESDISHDEIKSKFPSINNLIFAGLVGMIDPPRPGVKESIKSCKKAGITVFMATGDHKLTAMAIGNEIGISEDDNNAIDGNEIDALSDNELKEVLKSVRIFARLNPDHKHRIVQILQSLGYIVAVTGDGINDAPAIKAAEVGLAMGISGTDVTKETAEVILVDDNFSTIVTAIEGGRVVYENIQKVVKYLITTNIGEDLTIVIALLIFPLFFMAEDPKSFLIFTAVQILWVNLVTDGVLDITLALEPKEKDLMKDKPRDPDKKIIDKTIIKNILYVSSCMAIGTLGLYLIYFEVGNPGAIKKAKTVAFIALSMFQVFNALNCRSRTQSVFKMGLFSNKWLIVAIIFSTIVQFIATINPFLQEILQTVPLMPEDWLLIVIISSSVLFIDELRKKLQKN